MLNAGIEVTQQIEDSRYQRDRTVYRYVRVEYYVGKHGPFRLELSREDIDAGRRDELVNADAEKFRT